ncbi:MAG: ABC transporter ATP-binding protein [Acidimicrobiales bacterium]
MPQEQRGLDVHCMAVVHLYRTESAQVVALRGVDLDIEAGEMVALLGPSGNGKSTLLRLIGGLIQPSAGQIRVGGDSLGRLSPRELRALRATSIGVVLQDAGSNLLAYGTAAENVYFAQSGARRARSDLLDPLAVLDIVGLADQAARPVNELSGGDQQRAALAAGIAASPRLLLVDEPTSQLDAEARDGVVAALRSINTRLGSTVVMVTHDPEIAHAMARTVTIRDGRVGTEGRHGEEYAVVGRDGSVQLPPHLLDLLPPDTLVRLHRHERGVNLEIAEPDR